MRHTILLALLLSPLGFAQNTTVFPGDWASREGNTSENRLPLSNGISRCQIVYDRIDLPITSGHQITEVGFRQDAAVASTGRSVQLAIYMGGTTKNATTLTNNFANNNDGTALTLVYGPTIYNLPTFTTATTNQEFWIPLVTPYTVHANENLLVEYVVTANSNGNAAFNYNIDEGSYYTATQSIGTGCQSSAGQVPLLTVSSASYLGGSLSYSLTRAPSSSLVWLNLDTVPFAPLDLALFGAPGCTLYTPPTIAIPGQGNTSGSASFSFALPATPALLHTTMYGQSLIFDLFGNALGFVMSNGTSATLGMLPLATQIYSTGSTVATTGTIRRNAVAVSLFHWN